MTNAAAGVADNSSNRVLLHLVGGNGSRGGVMTYVRQLLQLDLTGFQQRVWKHTGYADDGDSYLRLGNARITDVSLAADVNAALVDFVPLYRWLRRNPTAVLYAHSRAGSILATLIRQVQQVPVITHVHAHWRRTGLHKFLWRAARSTVVFNSARTCRHFGQPVDSAHIHMPPLQWPGRPAGGEGRLVACGAIQPIKNIHLIIEAFAAAGDGAPPTLHIYGISPEPLDAAYQQQIIQLAGKNPRIRLHNWDESWAAALRGNDVFIHASSLESFGITMLEAFARGCRMVVPHDTFLNDLSRQGVFGADLTAKDLAKAILLAASYTPESDLWEVRRLFEDQFALQTTRQKLAALLRQIAAPASQLKDKTALSQIVP